MIETFEDPEALASAAADAVIHALDFAIRRNGSAGLVGTGGRSPGPIYDKLAVAPLDWEHVRITLSDERWVETDSPESNERLIGERLLQGRASAARFVGLRGTGDSLESAAATASSTIAALPPFDVVMLGMGEDGHVASLFSGNPALDHGLDPHAPACIPVPVDPGRLPPVPRLSLSIRPLTTAGLVLILTSGVAKKAALEEALAGASPAKYPVAAVLQSAPAVRILWTA